MTENLIKKIDWKKCNGLVPAIIQDQKTAAVLKLGFMNEEALKLTCKTKKVHFFSRTKNRIWMKGETSGNVLNLVNIELDCDNGSLLILVDPIGNTCHLGNRSCFKKSGNFLMQLEEIIDQRIKNQNAESYVSKMHNKDLNKIAQKVGEEGVEVVIAALNEGDERLLNESADLLFHYLILLQAKGYQLNDVVNVLKNREK